MARVTVICIHADGIIEIRRKRTHANQMIWDKTYSPTFTSTFEEARTWSPLRFWRGRRRFLLWLYGTPRCFEVIIPKLDEDAMKDIAEQLGKAVKDLTKDELAEFDFPYWNLREATQIIAKIIAKSKADQRVISGFEFYILLALNLVSLVLILMIARVF